MGHTVWIDVQGRGDETHSDMNVLLRLSEKLDVLAVKLEVAKLSSFFDYSKLIQAYGESDESSEPSWFKAEDGMVTVATLNKSIQADWAVLGWSLERSEQHYPDTLLTNLKFCESVLEQAVAQQAMFRLLIVP